MTCQYFFRCVKLLYIFTLQTILHNFSAIFRGTILLEPNEMKLDFFSGTSYITFLYNLRLDEIHMMHHITEYFLNLESSRIEIQKYDN